MKKRWIGGLAGLVLAFILAGCGATGQVESLSPEEMKEYMEQNDSAYILINSTEDQKERKENINLVKESIESINVKEINFLSEEMLNQDLNKEDVGLSNIVLEALIYYKNGEINDYVSLSNSDYSSNEDKRENVQKFIDETSS
ncbi:hypothetical protein MUO14_09245 [Halobacillus shinanisalinarum]|uniref:Lipoprotein n=1 Tax=Halobacillus shinanisalinarum TaxID=2932258 RepID=A0ABY4H4F4_9BACI|nr:hypothetical protein [Halobacillus shinanisalinarum]UOQ95091.1 hypothetical protein MUO14_09245 [Halobacillus shinanisalinarum]